MLYGKAGGKQVLYGKADSLQPGLASLGAVAPGQNKAGRGRCPAFRLSAT